MEKIYSIIVFLYEGAYGSAENECEQPGAAHRINVNKMEEGEKKTHDKLSVRVCILETEIMEVAFLVLLSQHDH